MRQIGKAVEELGFGHLLTYDHVFGVEQTGVPGRSRAATATSQTNFIGGAIGSAAALWSAGTCRAVTVAAATASCVAFAVSAVGRRGPLVVGS